MVRKAKVVGTTDQPHTSFQMGETTSRVPAATGQARHPLSESGMQAFDKSGIQIASSLRGRAPLNGG
jgi:hypothetical protein